jgi:hypothetical protein
LPAALRSTAPRLTTARPWGTISSKHKSTRIGWTTERIVNTDALRRGLLVIMIALAALLLATSTGALGLVPPW